MKPKYRERLASVRRSSQRSTRNLYDTVFTRRISAYITALLLPLHVSPNLVSAVNLGVGVVLCALIATGERHLVLAGALAFHLYAVLDSVDGELARAQGRSSLPGMFLEAWSAYLMINGFSLAVGAYLWRTGAGLVPLGLALFVAVFARNAAAVARRVVIEVAEKAPSAGMLPKEPPINARPPGPDPAQVFPRGLTTRLRNFVEESLLYQTNVWLVLSSLLALESLFPPLTAHLVLAAFVFYSAGALLKEAGIVWLALTTPYLASQINRLRGGRNGGSPGGGAPSQ